jgi:hypothetical protein
MFPQLNLPESELKIRHTEKGMYVFDAIRKKYVVLTPEEYVRQSFLSYLIHVKHFPKGLTAVEKQLDFYDLKKRTDIVVYDTFGNIVIIVECKSTEVQISQSAFDQIARYNMKFKSEYLIVTNGITHYCCKPNYLSGAFEYLKEIPDYQLMAKDLKIKN